MFVCHDVKCHEQMLNGLPSGMQDIQSGIKAGSFHTITSSPGDPSPQLPIIPYENDAESSTKPKRRRTEGPNKTTISEKNRKAWRVQAEMVSRARKLMEVNQPFPPDVRKAYDSYERHKRRSREYQRNKRAPKIVQSEEQKQPDSPIVTTTPETALTFVHSFSSPLGNSLSSDRTRPLNGTTVDHAVSRSSTSVHTDSSSPSSSSSVGNPLTSSSHMSCPINSTSIDPQFFNARPRPFDRQLDPELPQESTGSQTPGSKNTVEFTPRSSADKVVGIPGNHPRIVIELYKDARTKDNDLPDKFELSPARPDPRGVHQLTFSIADNDILSVSAKTTGSFTITNDMDRHSKEGIEYVVQEAEKYKDDEEVAASRLCIKSCLDAFDIYVHNLRNTLSDDKLADKFDPADKIKLEAAIERTVSWLESSKKEYESKQKELEGLATPIMQRLYGSAGGAPNSLPGSSPKKRQDS